MGGGARNARPPTAFTLMQITVDDVMTVVGLVGFVLTMTWMSSG